MKSYEVKIYTHNGNYKRTLKMSDMISDISFSETINGGQGNLKIELKGDSSHFKCSDIVEVRETDNETDTNVYPTYTGIINSIETEEYEIGERIDIEVVGIFTLLNEVLYKSGGTHTFTKNDTPGNIAKDIIDSFNAKYGTLTETQNLSSNVFEYGGNVDITGSNIQMEFKNITCLQALQNISKGSDFYFFIGANGELVFKKVGTIKLLTFKREIISIKNTRKQDDMVNTYYLERSGSGTLQTYINPTSVTNFNIRERHEQRSEIQNISTQNLVGNTTVSDYGNEIKEIFISIKPQINPFLYPGMEVSTQNVKNPISNQRVTKIDKRKNIWNIYFGEFTSFGKTILSK